MKIYEFIQQGQVEAAKKLLRVHSWINANVRNILDESDAILQPKYQVVYTMGNQMTPDGGSQRWIVVQALLKHVSGHMKRLYDEYGEKKLEFDIDHYQPDIFTHVRILDENMFELLKIALIDDFLANRFDIDFTEVDASMKNQLKHILMHKEVNAKSLKVLHTFSTNDQNIIMILSGLLRFEVLKLALMKRWRVNYGVDKENHRKMAVPFKAKDVAAEMTEFGHPDVAICLTQISYYYSGEFYPDQSLHLMFKL